MPENQPIRKKRSGLMCLRISTDQVPEGFEIVFNAARFVGVPVATYVRMAALKAARADMTPDPSDGLRGLLDEDGRFFKR